MEFLYQTLAHAIDALTSGDAALVSTTWRTLRLALESTFVALLVGLPVGVCLGEARSRTRRGLVIVANAGLGLPPVVVGVALAISLRPNSALGGLHWSYTFSGMVLAQALLAFPIVVALTAAAVSGLPEGLLDQARAFGASPLRRGVLALREARIGVLAAVTAAMLSAIAEVGAVVLVGGNARGVTNTLASTVLIDLAAGDPARAMASVLALLALVLIIGGGLTVVQQRVAR